MSSLPIIETAHLFPELDGLLVDLLGSLSPDEWERPTVVPLWNVRQVAGHLLDTACRRLTLCRDGWQPTGNAPHGAQELIELVNRLNADGVRVYGGLSPQLIIEFTALVTPMLAAYLASRDAMAPASFAVSWAGEDTSRHWFDVAREFTERWHHQQQIRLATNREGIMTPRLYRPVLDTFMRVLPHTYRSVHAPVQTVCEVVVPGACGGRWRIRREHATWSLVSVGDEVIIASSTIIPADLAWRLFTKGASREEIRTSVAIDGDEALGAVACDALAIVG